MNRKTMDTFTDIYNKSISLLKTSTLDSPLSGMEDKLKLVLQPDGPDATHAASLDELRAKLHNSGKVKSKEERVTAILSASQSTTPGFQNRVALINTMEHLYLVQKKGNQCIWVMDSPKRYSAWPYDQLANKTEASVKVELTKDRETFGNANRKMISDALQLARKWSTDVQIKLANEDVNLLNAVRCWFHEPGATDAEVKNSVALLLDGFKKITHACNSTRIIFSDRPHLRTGGIMIRRLHLSTPVIECLLFIFINCF